MSRVRLLLPRQAQVLGLAGLLIITLLAGLPGPAAAQDTAELGGSVSLRPEYALTYTTGDPWRVVVLLDVSGAMSLNLAGEGVRAGETIQCSPGQPGGPPARFCGWSPPAWPVAEERRIFSARALLARYLQALNLPGAPGRIADLPPDQVEIVPFSHGVSYNPAQPWGPRSSDLAALSRRAAGVGAYQGDPYRTVSFSNPAAAVQRAGQLLARGAPTTTYQGREFTYRPHILLISGGMATHLLDPAEPNLNGELSGPRTYALDNPCALLGVNVIVTPLCMTSEIGGQYTRRRDGAVFDRPFTELVRQTRQLGQAQINVVQLGADFAPGLIEAASDPSAYYQVDQLAVNPNGQSNLDEIADRLAMRVLSMVCQPQVEPFTELVPPSRAGAGTDYPQVGEVSLVDSASGVSYMAPIMAGPDARLSYSFPEIPPGTYALSGYVLYRHPADGITRVYSLLFQQDEVVESVVVNVAGGIVRYDLALALNGSACAAP